MTTYKMSAIVLLSWAISLNGYAASTAACGAVRDSLLPMHRGLPVRLLEAVNGQEKMLTAELGDIESGYSLTGDQRKAFTRLLRIARGGVFIWNRKARFRLYNDLAGISARLRFYPAAMRCYYAAEHPFDPADSAEPGMAEDQFPEGSDPVEQQPTIQSMPVSIQNVLASFADGREAAAYALLVEIKQPVPGKRRAFTRINNVGHTFITLIKYNKDNSVVCRSFGFYPRKASPLSATPLHPSSPSVIKDDSAHEWDELAGKFISYRRFKKVIDALQSYDHSVYNLNRNNCTDFGLALAQLGGISIADTRGSWPLGRGNNPGSAGQSLLDGKVQSSDEGYKEPLFVSTNDLPARH